MSERHALIVVNRRGTRGRRGLDRAIERLESGGIEVFARFTRQPDQIPTIVRRLAPGADMVVIGGGDGTLSAALQSVLDTGLPLGILPMGNANDLARTLGVPTDLAAAADIVARGRTRRIDLGDINGRPFLNIASIGIGARIAKRLTSGRKLRWGVIGYLAAAWEAMHRHEAFTARISCDDCGHERRCIQVAVGNGRYYGGGMTIVDDAAIDDGRLDLYALPPVRWWRLLVLVPVLRRGRHRPVRDILSLHGSLIRIETDPPLAINVDGEVVATTPATFSVRRQALSVFVP